MTTPEALPRNAAERRRQRNTSGRGVAFDAVAPRGEPTPLVAHDATLPPGCAPKSRYFYAATIRSGANHVVKRLFDQRAGVAVRMLHRSAFGPATLEGLDAPGSHRTLSVSEVAALEAAGGGAEARIAARTAGLARAARAARAGDGCDARVTEFLAAGAETAAGPTNPSRRRLATDYV